MLSRARSLLLNAALAVVLLAGAVAVASETGLVNLDAPTQIRATLGGKAQKITVRGRVKGLYPGRAKMMRIRVRSPYPVPVDVRSIRTALRNASPSCTRQYLRVERFRGRQPIAPLDDAFVFVKAKMARSAPDACQNARFPLDFLAKLRGQGQRP